MRLSPKDFSQKLERCLLTLLWRHWTALGVATHVPAEDRYPLDLEALLCATLVLSEHDRRLDKLASEWLSANSGLVSTSRLSRIWGDFEKGASRAKVGLVPSGKSARLDELLASHGFPIVQSVAMAGKSGDRTAWKRAMAGIRPGKAGATSSPSVWSAAAQLALRRLFGVNARAEVLLYLLSGTTGNSAGIARSVGYDQKSVYRILESWVQAGYCVKLGKPAGQGYGLTRPTEWQRLLGIDATVAWIDWASVLLPLLLVLQAAWTGPRKDDEYLLSSLMRDMEEPLAAPCRLWRLPFPNGSASPGAAFFQPAARAILDLASAMAGECSHP